MLRRLEATRLWKLTPSIAAVVAIALLLAGIAMGFYNERVYTAQQTDEVQVQAQILASSVAAALAFNDAKAAREYVNALRANPEIRAAAVYDANGRLFASYSRSRDRPLPSTVRQGPPYMEEGHLVVAMPVTQAGSVLGTVYLRSLIEPFARRLSRYVGIGLLVTMASMTVIVLGAAHAALSSVNAELKSRARQLADANRSLQMQIEEREKAEEALRQSQKMEAIGHLTGGIAHDFNNLLQVIAGNLDLVAPALQDNPRASQRLRSAVMGAERAARLTQQLLAFARRQPLQPKVISLGRVMGEVADLLRRTLGEKMEVECVIGGGLWNTMADVAQLENAILNLALNARDAMPGGGKLTIEVANAFLNDDYVDRNSDAEPGQYVMITVTDTGVGMTPEEVGRAFEPFYTTKPEGQGTGLGLSQVYGFVKQSGGHIKIYSEKGVGTSVKIYLPRVRRAEESLPVHTAAASSGGGGECVLVVEDDAAVRTATVDTLEQLGYKVLQAPHGGSALEILRSKAPIDLLFTDVVMPGPVTSRDLAREAAALQPGIAVLFTSGYTENAIIHHGRLDEGVHLLSKPYRKDELARKLRSVLDARAAPSVPAPPSPHRLKLLVVEDEELVRLATVDMITALGHDVVEAANGAEARRAFENVDGIDILFTDLGLPDANGAALAAEMRTRRPELKVVIATGYSDSVAKDGSDTVGLSKPFSADDIERAIQRLLASRQSDQEKRDEALADPLR